jgi:hypothetical protein
VDQITIATGALGVSMIVGIVGILNLAFAISKVKLDLYDRRFKIYEDVLALYQTIYDVWDEEKVRRLELAMIRSFRESKFLFDPKDGVYDVIARIKDANAKNSAQYRVAAENRVDEETLKLLRMGATEGRMAFDRLILELEDKLSHYLNFRKVNGWI